MGVKTPLRSILLSLFIIYLAVTLIPWDASAEMSTGASFIDIEEENVYLEVSPEDSGTVSVDVTLGSLQTRNMIYRIETSISGAPTWTSEGPGQLYTEPGKRVSFSVTVISPLGETAGKRATLTVKAVPDTGSGELTDSCKIEVLPYRWAEIEGPGDNHLLDLTNPVSIPFTVINRGNTDARISVVPEGFDGVSDTDAETEDLIPVGLLEPGEEAQYMFEYEMDEDLQSTEGTLGLISGDRFTPSHFEIELIREGSLIHALFSRGPHLILLPTPADVDTQVQLFCLGGSLDNAGFEIVEGPEGARLDTIRNTEISNLQRMEVRLSAYGFTGKKAITVRAYGFSDERKVTSNRWTFMAQGKETTEGMGNIPVVVGGSAAGISAVAVGTAAYLYSASEVFRYRWLLLAFVPLYSTVRGEKVLDHFFRGRLYERIQEHPGVTFTALKEHFEVNNGTLTYHLHKLEKEELITHRNLGKYKMFYADGVRIKGCEVVISPLDREMLEIISREPGITTTKIIGYMRGRKSRRTLSRHLKQLERKGFIDVKRSGGTRSLYISGEFERALVPDSGVVEASEITSVDI